MCWTFLGTQSMISSQRVGQNLLDLRGKMRLTTLTVFDERPKPQPELFNLEQISQVGRKWITVQQPPASSRGCAYHCAGCGLCTTIVILCQYSMTPTDRQPPFANFFTTPNNLQSLEILWTKSPHHNRWLADLVQFLIGWVLSLSPVFVFLFWIQSIMSHTWFCKIQIVIPWD